MSSITLDSVHIRQFNHRFFKMTVPQPTHGQAVPTNFKSKFVAWSELAYRRGFDAVLEASHAYVITSIIETAAAVAKGELADNHSHFSTLALYYINIEVLPSAPGPKQIRPSDTPGGRSASSSRSARSPSYLGSALLH